MAKKQPKLVPPGKSWRDFIKIHPEANKYPLFEQKELIETADDIKKNGLKFPCVLGRETCDSEWVLCDGRNRLDAMEAVGIEIILPDMRLADGVIDGTFETLSDGTNLIAWITSANLYRRHLTNEQKNERLEAVLKAEPHISNRQAAKKAGVSHTQAAKTRAKLEESGGVATVATHTDTKGRKQPATKPRRESPLPRRRSQSKRRSSTRSPP